MEKDRDILIANILVINEELVKAISVKNYTEVKSLQILLNHYIGMTLEKSNKTDGSK